MNEIPTLAEGKPRPDLLVALEDRKRQLREAQVQLRAQGALIADLQARLRHADERAEADERLLGAQGLILRKAVTAAQAAADEMARVVRETLPPDALIDRREMAKFLEGATGLRTPEGRHPIGVAVDEIQRLQDMLKRAGAA